MSFSEVYRRQVQLLVRTLPLVAEEDCFALKGGTAILSHASRDADEPSTYISAESKSSMYQRAGSGPTAQEWAPRRAGLICSEPC